jgi:hypothetical protein
MADPVLFSNAAVWLGGYDLTGSLKQIDVKLSKAELANSRFGDLAETFEQGLEQVDASLGGFHDYAALGTDVRLYPRIKSDGTSWPLTVAPPYATAAAPAADGNIAYTICGKQFSLEVSAAHGELLPYTLTSRLASTGTGAAVYRQKVVLPKASRIATTTGTGYQLGAVSATQKIVAVLHVFSVTGGGTWTLTVESDDNAPFASATTRATFTGATDVTRQVIETNGAIADDYWRVVLTKTGGTSCIAAALLSIEPQ